MPPPVPENWGLFFKVDVCGFLLPNRTLELSPRINLPFRHGVDCEKAHFLVMVVGVNATGVLYPTGGLSRMEDCIPVDIAQEEGNTTWDYENLITADNSRNRTNFSMADPAFDISMQEGMEEAEVTLYSRVVVCICVAGLVGNILNMTVLTHRRLRTGW